LKHKNREEEDILLEEINDRRIELMTVHIPKKIYLKAIKQL